MSLATRQTSRIIILREYSQKQNMMYHGFYVDEILKTQTNKMDKKWISCCPGLGGEGDMDGKGA